MNIRYEQKHMDFMKQTSGLLTGEAYRAFIKAFPDFQATYGAFATKRSKMGECRAESKKLKWSPEMLDFIKSTKGQDRETAYKAFCERFSGITATAFYDQRSRSGVSPKKPHGKNSRAKLYEEREKGGYIVIKVAEPSAWISKARWVYEETHPWERTEKSDNFIFLNGDNRDFRPENIERVKKTERTLFQKYGGTDKNPEITRVHLLQARMRTAQLDLGEKIGKVKRYKNGRQEVKK